MVVGFPGRPRPLAIWIGVSTLTAFPLPVVYGGSGFWILLADLILAPTTFFRGLGNNDAIAHTLQAGGSDARLAIQLVRV